MDNKNGMPMASIQTLAGNRLAGERISDKHVKEILRLHSDPEVMKTLSADGNILSEDKTREGMGRSCRHWEENGFGLWVFRERKTGRFIGRAGLLKYEIDAEAVIGLAYAVLSESWGRGYATEMSRMCLDVAFLPLGFDRVSTWALPANLASQRVMQKLGFEYQREFTFSGLLHRYYELTRDRYQEEHGKASGGDIR